MLTKDGAVMDPRLDELLGLIIGAMNKSVRDPAKERLLVKSLCGALGISEGLLGGVSKAFITKSLTDAFADRISLTDAEGLAEAVKPSRAVTNVIYDFVRKDEDDEWEDEPGDFDDLLYLHRHEQSFAAQEAMAAAQAEPQTVLLHPDAKVTFADWMKAEADGQKLVRASRYDYEKKAASRA